jgi:hypothetical protein
MNHGAKAPASSNALGVVQTYRERPPLVRYLDHSDPSEVGLHVGAQQRNTL